MLLGFPRAFWISLCNVVGLAFSLFGLLLLFFYALPNEIPGSPGFIAFSPGWQEKQRHYETCTHWGFALAVVGTIMEGVPPVCMTIGSARRRRISTPNNDDLDAPAPP